VDTLRPLSTYLNTLIGLGVAITEVAQPGRPDDVEPEARRPPPNFLIVKSRWDVAASGMNG
jgi:hypothetical protein